MEAPKRKVTAKLSSHNINGHNGSSSTSPSLSPPPQVVVRAKISSTARSRTASTASNTPHPSSSISGALRPQVRPTARRSPSPAKMRPLSPTKPQSQPRPATMRAPVSEAAALRPHSDHMRHGSISSVLSLAPVESATSCASAPSSPLSRTNASIHANRSDSATYGGVNSGTTSLRIKSKLSGVAKPVPPSISTILSPPSPSSSSATSSLPSTTRLPRARATTVVYRRSPVTYPASLAPAPQATFYEQPQLVPLPTSPPASTLSFSSRSSTSASASSGVSYSTSTGMTPPLSFGSYARSDSLSISGERSLQDDHPTASPRASPPLKRTLVARMRPGTTVSGGREHGWTSGSSITREPEPGGVGMVDLNDESSDESGHDDDATRKRRPQSGVDEHPDDDVRAEAKTNRKIADLEITTRSLLTINAALETSKLRQAREIRELRRKLREARLAMPPGRFRLLAEEEGPVDAEGEETDEEAAKGDEGDESFKRIKSLVEGLLATGRDALSVPVLPPLLSTHRAPPPSSEERVGLGLATGTRVEQGEVLGWDVGSSLGSEAGAGAETGARRWKHGVAIGSRVLSPEEAELWAGGKRGDERGEDSRGEEVEMSAAGADEEATHPRNGVEPDTDVDDTKPV